jgi:DNA-binding transcriptional ArsR family regulator
MNGLHDELLEQDLCLPAIILSPEHISKMGAAIFVFAWLWIQLGSLSKRWGGLVRNGESVSAREISNNLGIKISTVRHHLSILKKAGYLETRMSGRGNSMLIKLWPPKEGPEDSPAIMYRDILSRLSKPNKQPSRDEICGLCQLKYGQVSDQVCEDIISLGQAEITKNYQAPGSGCQDINRQNQHPPRPPLKGIKDCCYKEPTTTLVSSDRGRKKRTSPTKRTRPKRTNPLKLLEIKQQLKQIQEFERPVLTLTLEKALLPFNSEQLKEIFQQVWRFHQTRNKALENPAGWWAKMLVKSAENYAKILGLTNDNS